MRYFFRWNTDEFTLLTYRYEFFSQVTVLIYYRVGLCNDSTHFFNRRQVFNFICYTAIYDFTVWSFQEAEIVTFCVNRKRVDQTNVWTFRCFNWTYTTVMRLMYVTYFEARTFTRQTTRPKC